MTRSHDAERLNAASGPLDWAREQDFWPHAKTSEFVEVDGVRWHVQRMGRGPTILLIHGTGASTHSWRNLAPLLAKRFTVIAPDLPAHGFTGRRPRQRLSLTAMAASLTALSDALALRPALVVGHSAGAAILIRCCLDGGLAPAGIVSLNGALLPFRGAAGILFPPLAKLMFLNPLTPRLIAHSAVNRDRVIRVIHDTGSELDPAGIDFYARLFRSPEQISAALSMMAHWDLRGLARELYKLEPSLLLIAGENDKAVPPDQAETVARRAPHACVARMSGLGHLAHEEDPGAVAAVIERFADQVLS
ncbi:MAG: alpha/beta fold hydrolase BchO [Wenzhouxiangellaceae bacterium]